MFGFIAPPCSRCTGGSFPAWRGTFCGLSRCLAREFGQPARVLVNRDAAFVALLGIGLDPSEPRWKPATCCNPLATPFPVVDDHAVVRHVAAATVCGLAVKLDDDRRDEGPIRRGVAAVARGCVAPAARRAVALLNASGFPTEEVSSAMARQPLIEAEDPERADVPTAAAFGAITAHVASLVGVPGLRDRLDRVGRSLGSLVYWRDAWQDRRDDARRGRFNPFARMDPALIQGNVAAAWGTFSSALNDLPFLRHAEWISGIHRATETTRRPFLQLAAESAAPEPRESKKRPQKPKYKNSCADRCDWCRCCDVCVDCGPGDRGCCDANPCDGCDCCPCH